jgi:hypothetical protein
VKKGVTLCDAAEGLIGFASAVGCPKIGLRLPVFSDSGIARRLGAPGRKAEWCADPRGEKAYWKLPFLFLAPADDTVRDGEIDHALACDRDDKAHAKVPGARIHLAGGRFSWKQ